MGTNQRSNPQLHVSFMITFFNRHGYIDSGTITNADDETLDVAALPPILRVLLVTDGTVTKTLESYFWEPVDVISQGQQQAALKEDCEFLGIDAGASVLDRQVRLVGRQSADVYAYANSYIILQLLPENLQADLLAGKIGIGELLRETELETYRELVNMGRQTSSARQQNSAVDYSGELIFRTYRIVINKKPAILVTEKFPYRLYASKP